MTDRLTDQDYVQDQYRDASKLEARVALYRRFSGNPAGLHRWVFDRIEMSEHGRLLEIGCGPGGLWVANRDRIPQSWIVNLTDFSPGMLEQARSLLAVTQHDFAFAAVDAQALPFQDTAFDGVIANHMLYHVPDKERALAEIKRVLKPPARFYATTLGKGHLQELGELAHAYNPKAPRLWSRLTESFGAENGSQKLAPFFATVTIHRFEDTLVVTEARPLVDYIRSTALGAFFDEAGFTRFIDDELSKRGSISIRSDTVMFEAYNSVPQPE